MRVVKNPDFIAKLDGRLGGPGILCLWLAAEVRAALEGKALKHVESDKLWVVSFRVEL